MTKKTRLRQEGGFCDEIKSGGVLLSHAVTHVVPLALQGLNIEFGMGGGHAVGEYFGVLAAISRLSRSISRWRCSNAVVN